ncbi:MAG: hypothetical protein OXN21_05420 [Chloroflexota bacterium]|nr:hypothetical protein [Chloroflexota bacterium]
MPSFSEQLKAEAQPIWRAIFQHPFLREIKDGTLPLEKFQYYLTQDYQYLEGFGRTVVMAMAKAPNSRTLEELSRRVMTPIERPLHTNCWRLPMCQWTTSMKWVALQRIRLM